MSSREKDRARFAAVFRDLSPRVFAYSRRRCDVADAQDVVADVFLVAWRRWSEVPDNPLPWLLVVARNTITNRRRTEVRRDHLTERIAMLDRLAGPASGSEESVIERSIVLSALADLTELEREAILLVGWDGLPTAEAAAVAGCSSRAFEVRLSRARARLSRAMTDTPSSPARTRQKASPLIGARYDATARKAT